MTEVPRRGRSMTGRIGLVIYALIVILWVPPLALRDSLPGAAPADAAVPRQVSGADLWLTASAPTETTRTLARAVSLLADGHAAESLPLFAKSTGDPLLGGYARLYMGRAEFAAHQYDRAARSAQLVVGSNPSGYLGEAALWLLADTAEAAARWPDAVLALQALTAMASTNPPLAYARLGRAAVKANDADTARRAFEKVYYDFPLSPQAADIAPDLRRLGPAGGADLSARRLARAEQLYGARRYGDARESYAAVGTVDGESADLVALRLAECDFFLKRYPAARDGLRAYLQQSTARRPEAEFMYLTTMRELGREDEYLSLLRTFVDTHPADPLAETALNDLGTYYILEDDDARAADVFTELYRRFPEGAFADRAAWKAGWWAYKSGDYPEAIRLFQSAAATFPRADYRPSWLYWTARAQARLGNVEAAQEAYAEVISSYRNSYYGRQAVRQVASLTPRRPSDAVPASVTRAELPVTVVAGTPPSNARLVRAMLAATMYDDAIEELRRVQRQDGTSPFLGASIAYALHAKGDLRPAITAMRRAYPQFMAEGGERLPKPILTVIFPVDYWDLIQKYATREGLDPYLMAALTAQESTFQADVRSAANAWGLMQLQPSTGRSYASKVGIRRFSTKYLTDPEMNIRIGMKYFSDLVSQYGDVVTALAAYNAGPNRAARWRAERPGIDQDEFIDDIPYPETQNYVKRILGTAEDYRVLYAKH